MAGLAAVLLRRGARVSGTDALASGAVSRLTAAGALICTDPNTAALPLGASFVVASAAIPAEHPELIAARQRGLRTFKYAEMLGLLMQAKTGIAIAGTHGKSTTTAWLTHVLRTAGLDPSFVIGADVEQLGGGSGVGDGPHFVAEACEYDRSFLNLDPHFAAILNVDEDHLDFYRSIDEIRLAFRAFAERVAPAGRLLLDGDDPTTRVLGEDLACTVETFGFGTSNDWRPMYLKLNDGRYDFDLIHRDEELIHVRPALAGRHNVWNAVAVAALAVHCGVPLEAMREGLETFAGARRRLETRANVRGITIVDDYAHHPAEIRATLQAARERFEPKRLWCVFQPHQHSRTRFLLDDFARSFSQADHVILPRIYFVRDSERERNSVSSNDLVVRIRAYGGDARCVPEIPDIVDSLVSDLQSGDVVITMGAGDIWKAADELVERL